MFGGNFKALPSAFGWNASCSDADALLLLMLDLAYLHVSTCPGLNLQATMDSDGFGIIPPRPALE